VALPKTTRLETRGNISRARAHRQGNPLNMTSARFVKQSMNRGE
jgi:hypothetical protein